MNTNAVTFLYRLQTKHLRSQNNKFECFSFTFLCSICNGVSMNTRKFCLNVVSLVQMGTFILTSFLSRVYGQQVFLVKIARLCGALRQFSIAVALPAWAERTLFNFLCSCLTCSFFVRLNARGHAMKVV